MQPFILSMEFSTLSRRAIEIQKQYNAHNAARGKAWGAREYAEGLVGDVGDLMKLIQAKEGYRDKGDHDAKIQHEIADILWSTIVLADQLGLDLEQVFMKEMDVLEERVRQNNG
ncbi:MAG: hypothetical protein RL141_115 [Candidatus Parcubacteria bacterium]|jgi:NTP pyrophosphatase (non-canonical NTP hydrolase)